MVSRLSRRHREALERGFEGWSYCHLVERTGERIRDPGFWRALCPGLSISERPFERAQEPYDIADGLGAEASRTILEDGYLAAPPIIRAGDAAALVAGAERILATGYPAGFAAVFDEFWRLFWGLDALLSPILGDDYLIVPHGLWLFHVPVGHAGSDYHAVAPHRDSLGPDPHLLATGSPSLINIWIALTDAMPLNSCVYVLPARVDDTYRSEQRALPAEIPLQDVLALPARRGSVLGWSSHLVHWGGRSSPRAAHPRASAALYLQRRDVAPFYRDVFPFGAPVPFEKRVEWIVESLGSPEMRAGG